MGPVVRYTAARLAMFGVALGVLYLLGARDLLLVVLAIVVSGLVSFIALSGQRDQVSSSLVRRFRDVNRRLDEGAAAEDREDTREDRHEDTRGDIRKGTRGESSGEERRPQDP